MGSFIGLTPFGSKIRVQGVDCLGRCNKGPNIRLLKSNGTFEELSYIDSVDKVKKGEEAREGGRESERERILVMDDPALVEEKGGGKKYHLLHSCRLSLTHSN